MNAYTVGEYPLHSIYDPAPPGWVQGIVYILACLRGQNSSKTAEHYFMAKIHREKLESVSKQTSTKVDEL